MASCSRDQTIYVWQRVVDDGESENIVEFECQSVMTGHSQDVKFVKWVEDSDVLVSCSYDDTIKIWDRDMDDDEWITVTTIVAHESTVWALDFNSPLSSFFFMVSIS